MSAPAPKTHATFLKTSNGNRFTVARITDTGDPPYIKVYLDSDSFDLGLSFKLDPDAAMSLASALRTQTRHLLDDEAVIEGCQAGTAQTA
jgi:hypothetical protein